ncbi:AcrR family transcriptional regulator [Xanthomonas campestris]|jgi:TetR/AcrR family transcriptional repressor for divergent bdcA|uniref:TetR/AcrR family transcriptional regulator n=1 Tax=Xanthomonas TaxID=338 RepID=UPI000CEEDB7F|nr:MULTISPECIES: TetR/AcrR family transcriptional regulator [Xanthomonas]NIJ91530.1 AcrR family transcriptional regulator [Xanthomonas euroxanthea]PPT32471.1 hypothetical protein XaCFBP7622_04840 [Xanthomonas arboricola]
MSKQVKAVAKPTARQRRPAFEREHWVQIAQELFHVRGYDAVGVAELTQAMGIVPPSLYAAYGSKLALFEHALNRYVATEFLPLDEILIDSGSPAEVLTIFLPVSGVMSGFLNRPRRWLTPAR